MKRRLKVSGGFTLVELIIVVALIAVLFAVIIFTIDPGRQLAKARNNKRLSDLNTIANAIAQNSADNKGSFTCATGPVPTSTKLMATSTGNYDIAPCLVPLYLDKLPFDPKDPNARYVTSTDYNTGYNIIRNATTGRITVSAPSAELGETIEQTR